MWYFAIVLPCQVVTDCQFGVAAGHSLGGAVALLCTLRLLQGLPKGTPSLHCICFGTPAIGNAALAALVAEYGWERHILNFILPGTAPFLTAPLHTTYCTLTQRTAPLHNILHPYTTYCTLTQRTAPLHNVHTCMLTSLSGCMSVVCSLSLLSSLCAATNSMLMGISML